MVRVSLELLSHLVLEMDIRVCSVSVSCRGHFAHAYIFEYVGQKISHTRITMGHGEQYFAKDRNPEMGYFQIRNVHFGLSHF